HSPRKLERPRKGRDAVGDAERRSCWHRLPGAKRSVRHEAVAGIRAVEAFDDSGEPHRSDRERLRQAKVELVEVRLPSLGTGEVKTAGAGRGLARRGADRGAVIEESIAVAVRAGGCRVRGAASEPIGAGEGDSIPGRVPGGVGSDSPALIAVGPAVAAFQ